MAQSLDRHNKAEKKEELVEKLVFVNRVAKPLKVDVQCLLLH